MTVHDPNGPDPSSVDFEHFGGDREIAKLAARLSAFGFDVVHWVDIKHHGADALFFLHTDEVDDSHLKNHILILAITHS